MYELDHRTVLVTGAAGNLGRAAVDVFAASGARLALVGRDLEKLRGAFADRCDPDRTLFLAADLTDATSTGRLAAEVEERFGGIDVLAHLAGAFRGGVPVYETPAETWDLMLGANLRALVGTLTGVVPSMVRQQRGSIVVVAARAALAGSEGLGAYSAAKAASLRIVESLAAELRGHHVRVNCVLPAAIEPAPTGGATSENGAVTPEALADVILFLASDASRALTGAAIPV